MKTKYFLLNRPIILCFGSVFLLSILFTCCSREVHSPAKDPLSNLMEGNERFQKNAELHPDESPEWRRSLVKSQHPFAIVVSCSDSRVPPEVIFDQGLGDLFVIRTAGNLVDSLELGSIEYAVEHLGVKQIVVLGHENCGAVTAFVEHEKVDGNMQKLVSYIENEPEEADALKQPGNHIHNCVIANIKHVESRIRADKPLLSGMFDRSELKIVGAVYDLETGAVKLIDP